MLQNYFRRLSEQHVLDGIRWPCPRGQPEKMASKSGQRA